MPDASGQERETFDVFISHNSQDKRAVFQVAMHLKERGLRVWLDAWELVPGRPIQEALERAITSCRAVAVLVGDNGLGPWGWPEMRAALAEHVEREVPVIPVLLPGAVDPKALPLFLKTLAAVDFRKGIAEPEMDRLQWGITGSKPGDSAHTAVRAMAEHESAERSGLASASDNGERDAQSERDPISVELQSAVERRTTLITAGGDTTAVDAEILQLKRKLREGGQLKPGDVLRHQEQERFVLLDQLGQGGFATVWRARDRSTGKLVAVKVLHGVHAQDRTRRERFFRGARVMADLKHDAIIRVLVAHAGEGGFHYFVMEYVNGGDLHHAVLEKRFSAEHLVPFMVELGQGLAAAHSQGLVHRDIKPANVLLDADNKPKLSDFDLVRVADTTGGTRTGAMGTFIYAAPELLNRPQDADARADVYGLGMTTLFALRGDKLPFDVLRGVERVVAQLDCADAIKDVILRAVAWEAKDRYADVQAYCEALLAAAEEMRVTVESSSETEPPPKAGPSDRESLDAAPQSHTEPQPAEDTMSTLGVASKSPRQSAPGDKSVGIRSRWPWLIAVLAIAMVATILYWRMGEIELVSGPKQAPSGSITAAPSERRRDDQSVSTADPLVTGPATASSAIAPRKCPKTMVLIQGGKFMVGSNEGDADEKPPHKAAVKSFCLDMTEVTVAAYSACASCTSADMSDNCNYKRAGREQHPINCVDWNQATVYCSSEIEGGRLPSEEEWEYAARGSQGRKYPWGDAPPSAQLLNVCGKECTYSFRMHGEDDGWPTTAPVGSFPKGKTPDYGLLDMAGNVWEWTASGYSSNYDAKRSASVRVTHGGSWFSGKPSVVRGAGRLREAPSFRSSGHGFRCARDLH